MGRPALVFTDEMIEKVEELAGQGLSKVQISTSLGINYKTLDKNIESNEKLSEAIKRGKTRGIQQVANALFNKAIEGDNVAMIFYLKNRDPQNWEDVQKRELYGKSGGDIKTDNKWTIEVVSAKPSDS